MIENTPLRQLPVRLPPHCNELLSSWIGRHAAFYAVPPLVMLRHCLPEASSLRAVDLQLSSDQEIRLADMFVTESAVVRQKTFANITKSSRRLIASQPTQVCTNCHPRHPEPAPILRSQLLVGVSRALCVEANSGIPAGANSPLLSSSIVLPLIVVKSCSTMKPSVVSERGHRQLELYVCYSCGEQFFRFRAKKKCGGSGYWEKSSRNSTNSFPIYAPAFQRHRTRFCHCISALPSWRVSRWCIPVGQKCFTRCADPRSDCTGIASTEKQCLSSLTQPAKDTRHRCS
jgi:hypothetical protein